MIAPDDIADRIAAIPKGTSIGFAEGTKFATTHSVHNDGRSSKIVAEQLGGADYISLNFYQLRSGARLYPCEMPADKVIRFLRTYMPEQVTE